RTLQRDGPATAGELAARAGIHPRYAREWLEQQTVSGYLECEDPSLGDDERRFMLPEEHVPALADEGHLEFMTPMAQLAVGCARPIEALATAFRTGDGVPFADYGEDLHRGQARFSRIQFDTFLTAEWLPAIPALHESLQRPGARVADLACGLGYSSLAMARDYPGITVDGIDLDAASIAAAGSARAAAEPEVAARVRFTCTDAADAEPAGAFDLVTIFEALHDMSRPVEALAAARRLLAPGGAVLVADERVGDHFSPAAGEVERLYYGFSVLHCLPVGMVGQDPAGTGTVMRAGTVERYAREAGLGRVEIAPVENDFWRFYVLRP
ncbi:MAG: class I SAM-dependent methyltransferase, partial [Miltoncostaeaceae bacterium]